MPRHQGKAGRERFGRYLRSWRKRRNLTIEGAAMMSAGLPERLSKSVLSRLETGQTVPSLSKLATLGRVLDVPLSRLVERYEVEQRLATIPVKLGGKTDHEIIEETGAHARSGRYWEALALASAALNRPATRPSAVRRRFKLWEINALGQLGYFESAKTEAEYALADRSLSSHERLVAWECFVTSCYRLKLFSVAMAGLEQSEKELSAADAPRDMLPQFAMLRGNVLALTGQFREAVAPYRKALSGFKKIRNSFQACSVGINLAEVHVELREFDAAGRCLKDALAEAESSGYDRLVARSLSSSAVLAFRSGNARSAQDYALRSNEIARRIDLPAVYFRNNWYLREIAKQAKDHRAALVCERALRAYLSRVDRDLPEARAYREELGLSEGSEGGNA